MCDYQIRELQLADYEAVLALWQTTPGISVTSADSLGNLAVFLARNRGLSFVAAAGTDIVGTSLCGHDGRRGFIYHLAVRPDWRRQGIGKRLLTRSLNALQAGGITKCHLFVLADNRDGMAFWEHSGFRQRQDIHIFSCDIASADCR